MHFRNSVPTTREQFYGFLRNPPRGLALETGRASTAPDAIQLWANGVQQTETLMGNALVTIANNTAAAAAQILALQAQLTASGTLSTADQAALDGVGTTQTTLLAQANAILGNPPAVATVPPAPVTAPTGP